MRARRGCGASRGSPRCCAHVDAILLVASSQEVQQRPLVHVIHLGNIIEQLRVRLVVRVHLAREVLSILSASRAVPVTLSHAASARAPPTSPSASRTTTRSSVNVMISQSAHLTSASGTQANAIPSSDAMADVIKIKTSEGG